MKIITDFKFTFLVLLMLFSGCKSTNENPGNRIPTQDSGSIISIAAAANLRDVLDELKQHYSKENPGKKVSLTFGSSGMLTQQIIHGAPFDLFLSADTVYPGKLVKSHKTKGKNVIYAYGRIVMWSAESDVSNGLNILLKDEIKKVAVANPQLAPYGLAAVKALKNKGLYDEIESKIVWAENISQSAQFVFSGSADVGFISLSNALKPEMQKKGKYYELPDEESGPIAQGGVVIKGKNEDDSQHFLEYIMHPKMKYLWEKYGYETGK